MYLNFVSFNLQTDLSEKAVSIQRYRSAATFMRLCGKNRVHGHAVELQFRAHKMLAIHVHVYICIRFTHYICDLDWLIIFPIESILCKYSILKNTTFEDQAWRVFRCSARFVSFYLYFYIFRKPTTSLTLYHLIIYTAFWSWINSSNFSFFRFFLSW